MGISIILTILGQIYLILYNLPMKDFGQSNFYNLYISYFYPLFFIGLRYSPRIIFSCSGFILSIKYLSFLVNKTNNSLIIFATFFFRQFYKYLILIIILLFMRHSYYHLQTNIFGIKPITELFNENVLTIPTESSEFILSLLGIKSFQIHKLEGVTRHYIIDYYWMAFNEIFFFIFGTILITIGFKYKIKIDYIIIALVIILYIGKIIFYIIWYNNKDENNKYGIYTTLYYYLFEYGEFMNNPIFNLVYYLIGIYFGLINYNVDKGILGKKVDMYDIFHDENDKDEESKDINIESKRKSENEISSFQLNEINTDKDDSSPLPLVKNTCEEIGKDKFDSLINKNNENNENSEPKNTNNNETNEINKNNDKENNNQIVYEEELKIMPFLIQPFNIKVWHEKKKKQYFYILLIIFIIIILLFTFAHYSFVASNEGNIKNSTIGEIQKTLKRFSLEEVITNTFLNIIYLIDIEIVVILVQWGFFIIYKINFFIIEFFNHHFWELFSRFYFSFLLACNSTILYIFYESETVVKLNTYNLILFFFIDSVFIFITTLIIYISLELPFKKISKYLFSNKYDLKDEEDNNEEEDDDNKKDNSDEDEDDSDEEENEYSD